MPTIKVQEKYTDITTSMDEKYPSPANSSKKKVGTTFDIYKKVDSLDGIAVGSSIVLKCKCKLKAVRKSEEGGYRYEIEVTDIAVSK